VQPEGGKYKASSKPAGDADNRTDRSGHRRRDEQRQSEGA
jgi:hypothetical protein